MKLLVVVLALVATCLTPQLRADTPEQAVSASVEKLRAAMVSADRTTLESLTAPDVVYAHSAGNVQTRDEFVEEIVSLRPNDYTDIQLTDQSIRVSGDVAVVRHIHAAAFASTDGKPGSLKIGVMQVWAMRGGTWKLVARQGYRLVNPQ